MKEMTKGLLPVRTNHGGVSRLCAQNHKRNFLLLKLCYLCITMSILLCFLLITADSAQTENKTLTNSSKITVSSNGAIVVPLEKTSAPYGYKLKEYIKPGDKNKKVPLLIFLHGAGGVNKGAARMGMQEDGNLSKSKYSCILVKPASNGLWEADKLDAFIDIIKKQYPNIDSDRIYIMGHSMGGYGSWLYCIFHGDKIAAMIASSGGFIRNTGPISKYNFKFFKNLPVQVFHNKDDKTVPVKYAEELVNAAKKAGGSPIFNLYDSGGHKYQVDKVLSKDVLKWLFSQSLKNR